MKILVANDDGVRADGFSTLINELKKIAHVTAIAPDSERSAAGHSITFFAPLRLKLLSEEENLSVYSCSGTPSDCVIMGLAYVMKDTPPDLVVTGINYGANLSDDATYSGTVSSAMEGALAGIPSIAVSIDVSEDHSIDYKTAAEITANICKLVYTNKIPHRTLLSVNVPNKPKDKIKGIKITHLGQSNFKYGFIHRKDAGERDYYWLTREADIDKNTYENSDYHALSENYVSITPIQLNLNCPNTSKIMGNWNINDLLWNS